MKNWLSHLRYHFNWQCTLGANFPKENDTWFFICKKLPFSLDSTSCCSIVLFFSCKLSPPNVLFTNFSQFSLHQISGKWTCPYHDECFINTISIYFFPFSLDSPNFFFIILLSSYKLSPPNILFQKLTKFFINWISHNLISSYSKVTFLSWLPLISPSFHSPIPNWLI